MCLLPAFPPACTQVMVAPTYHSSDYLMGMQHLVLLDGKFRQFCIAQRANDFIDEGLNRAHR